MNLIECYTSSIDIGPFWTSTPTVTRKLPPLKYYHDLTISNYYNYNSYYQYNWLLSLVLVSESIEVSWGPCLDPAFAQLNYAFGSFVNLLVDCVNIKYFLSTGLITKPSLDHSPPLPWWDKVSCTSWWHHWLVNFVNFSFSAVYYSMANVYYTVKCFQSTYCHQLTRTMTLNSWTFSWLI